MMARNYSNLASSRSECARTLPGVEGGFRGVDFSSSPHRVALYRLPNAQNMYRDYRSEEGGALETIPGFRRIKKLDGRINGLFRYNAGNGTEYIVAHAGTKLYLCREDQRDDGEWLQVSGSLEDNASAAFVYNNVMYLLDGCHYKKLKHTESGYALVDVSQDAYAPRRYYCGEEYEQRNALTDRYSAVTTGAELVDAPFTDESSFDKSNNPHQYVGVDTFVRTYNSDWRYPYCVHSAGVRVWCTTYLGVPGASARVENHSVTDLMISGYAGHVVGVVYGDALAELKALKRIYFVSSGLEHFRVLNSQGGVCEMKNGGQIFYDCGLDELKNKFLNNDDQFDGTLLAILPPNIVVRAGESVPTSDYTSLKKTELGSLFFYYGNIHIDPSASNEDSNIDIYNDSEGRICIRAGRSVTPGRYYFYGKLQNTKLRKSVYKMFRIEVVASNATDMPTPVQDVFGYDGQPLVFHLPEKTKEVHSVKDDGEEAGFGCYYDADGSITAVGVIARKGENEIVVEASAGTYTFKAGADGIASANPEYSGTIAEAISRCTLCATYDDRIFLSGNPDFPNSVFYSARNDVGVNDPSYFGVLNYFNDGVGGDRVTALFSFSDTLCVTKRENAFYHQGADGSDLIPRVYPSVRGNTGLGSLGACCSFLDDPVMLTKDGVYGVNKETLTLERTLGRRSSTVDARLLREKELEGARMVEWEGYLCLFVNGHVYMADSRSAYQDATGGMQYEWFYLCDIGVWRDESGLPTPVYAAETGALPIAGERVMILGQEYTLTETHEEIFFADAYTASVKGESILVSVMEGKAYAVYETGELAKEGTFHPAVCPMVVGDRLYFGADTGEVFVFNNDKRGVSVGDDEVEPSELHHSFYSFAGHRIDSGFITRFDDCGVPHLCKSTSSRSLVLRVKLMSAALFTIGVSTERERDRHMDEIAASRFGFAGTDFSALSFMVQSNATIVAGERERRWVEKQYLLRDGGYCRPFGVYNLTYRYRIAGRIRE